MSNELHTLKAAEIDGRIAEAEYAAMGKISRIRGLVDTIEKIESGERSYAYLEYKLDEYRANVTKLQEDLEWCKAVIRAGDEVYRERGGWRRYYLVTSSNGHVHRERNCSTCYFNTQFAWLTDLSDCDEDQMVEAYGEKACTVCFPNAPVHPAFKRSAAEREAEEAAKAAAKCPGSGRYLGGVKRYARCAVCEATVSVTRNGNARAHKRP